MLASIYNRIACVISVMEFPFEFTGFPVPARLGYRADRKLRG